ncbi:hypothetical protein GCM10011360_10840 [Primorskyibacter flagellatus]|uniref:Uncharacterized protein n=1 Tax=Primorskyibacter flagellatus TaxID=1387277 RepID=A0A917ED64_9RHOB|nr:hypothetical protein [Primorskyibacter flagellatus]GGE24188.1 hypothetical protein GCM10011360_10840 [Primorskyibacter flagellatus]
MRWNDIREDWDSYLPAITKRWPAADPEVLRSLGGFETDLALYLSGVTGTPARQMLDELEDWRITDIGNRTRDDAERPLYRITRISAGSTA